MVEFGTDNYQEGEGVTLNGEKFTFRAADQVVLSTDVKLGSDINSTLDNLVRAVRHSNGEANQAIFEYDSASSILKVISKEAGLIGNSYSFNVGGGGLCKLYL